MTREGITLSPLSGGITLELLEFVSCTPDWSPCPPADVSGGPTIFKLLKIDRLSLYLNPGETRLLHKLKDEHELLYWMKVLISSSERAPLELCYLLQPVFVRGKVSLKVSGEGLLSDFPDLHITISVLLCHCAIFNLTDY
ncbi:uncharacterized protein LOC135145166 [Zophobas morio]|uniref:uncharacterized protein LOC135145166 n=1 Tax=Zophobas morio TaxID=2755281 RepID=UPI003083E63D